MEEENGFKVYLAFSTGFIWYFFSFTGEWCSVEMYGKAPVIFRPKFFPLFPGVSATVSIHLVTPTAVLKLPFLFTGLVPGSYFGIRSARPLTATSVLKNWNSFSPFPLTKRALLPALGFWPIIWPLSSPFTSPCHAIHSGNDTDLCILFSVQLVTECRQLLAFILTWIRYFVQQAGRGVDLHSYSSFNGQSLGPVNSNTEGWGNWFYLSPLSGRPRDSTYAKLIFFK